MFIDAINKATDGEDICAALFIYGILLQNDLKW